MENNIVGKAFFRVLQKALSERGTPIFTQKMSHFQVYSKTLWQSCPVQQIKGKGTRGKSEATSELGKICKEMLEKIQTEKSQIDINK